MNKLNGQNIVEIHTLKSMYDGNCVQVTDDKGNSYRMNCSTILSMVNEFVFSTELKRVHTHLKVDHKAT